MAGVFARSWEITKLSFSVIKKDKELLAFPILSGVFSLIFIIALFVPTFILGAFEGEASSSAIQYLILFLVYLGLAFIATFFNVCTVYTAKIRFSGGDATFSESIKFAFSKIHLIFLWSLVSALVGLILRAIEQAAERAGNGGKIALNILRGLLGAAWSIMTLFVIPVMVYKGLGPFASIKESVKTIKKTWGESLVREFGLGLIQIILIVIGIIVTVLLMVLTVGIPVLFWSILLVGIIYVVGVILVFGIANSIYNTALYVYAETGKIPDGFNSEVLKGAFAEKKDN